MRVSRRLGYGFLSLNSITVAWGAILGKRIARSSNRIVVINIIAHTRMPSTDPSVPIL
ncbi:hypothetical protein BJY01DRAFT_220757 [Aspergillus pseudoustus]|uniref:Major facilitator superfamily (MFS) profile domain-containing protein n=1 Tax=Aspergillus pseudoustus TaxID=1810923 RepID=A0ABR4JD32_9EURO